MTSIAVKVVHAGTFRELDDIEMYVLGLLCDSEDADPGLPVRTDVLQGLCVDKLGAPCIDRIMQMCEAGYIGQTDDKRAVGVLREGQAAYRRQESKWKERVAGAKYDYDKNKNCVLSPKGRAALLKDWKISVPTGVEDQVATPSPEADEGSPAPSSGLNLDTGIRKPTVVEPYVAPAIPGKARPLGRL